uniref:Uncharacterized protein n=1 Tax=Oryza nivara TaxID=4536 RepID=A0A0E0HVQ4_ORYNI
MAAAYSTLSVSVYTYREGGGEFGDEGGKAATSAGVAERFCCCWAVAKTNMSLLTTPRRKKERARWAATARVPTLDTMAALVASMLRSCVDSGMHFPANSISAHN